MQCWVFYDVLKTAAEWILGSVLRVALCGWLFCAREGWGNCVSVAGMATRFLIVGAMARGGQLHCDLWLINTFLDVWMSKLDSFLFCTFFSAVAKGGYHLRHVRPSTCLSVCLSVCTYQRISHWMDFRDIWYWKLFWKSVKKILNVVKIGQKCIREFVWSFVASGDIKSP